MTPYVPEVVTTNVDPFVMLDHVFPVAYDDVNVTLDPSQNVVEPLAVITGVVGGVGSLND